MILKIWLKITKGDTGPLKKTIFKLLQVLLKFIGQLKPIYKHLDTLIISEYVSKQKAITVNTLSFPGV